MKRANAITNETISRRYPWRYNSTQARLQLIIVTCECEDIIQLYVSLTARSYFILIILFKYYALMIVSLVGGGYVYLYNDNGNHQHRHRRSRTKKYEELINYIIYLCQVVSYYLSIYIKIFTVVRNIFVMYCASTHVRFVHVPSQNLYPMIFIFRVIWS